MEFLKKSNTIQACFKKRVKWTKGLGLVASLIMIFSAIGCVDNNANSFPINPDNSNSANNTDEDSKKMSFGSNIEIENTESSGNDEKVEENDDSSSNENENKPSNETNGWTGFY